MDFSNRPRSNPPLEVQGDARERSERAISGVFAFIIGNFDGFHRLGRGFLGFLQQPKIQPTPLGGFVGFLRSSKVHVGGYRIQGGDATK